MTTDHGDHAPAHPHTHHGDGGHHGGHPADPTLYRTPADAAAAPPEHLAYVVGFDRGAERPDALFTLDTDPAPASYGTVVDVAELPTLAPAASPASPRQWAMLPQAAYVSGWCPPMSRRREASSSPYAADAMAASAGGCAHASARAVPRTWAACPSP